MNSRVGGRPRWRRWCRRGVRVCGGLLAVWGVAGLLGMPWTAPFDYATTAWPVPEWSDLRCEAPTVVVMQHGITRSAGALWRLERALRSHGYDVVNESYPSTTLRIDEHAERLRDDVERVLRGRPATTRLAFIGHSMGGLVIRSYLSRDDARDAHACLFLGTPQRGAILATKRVSWWAYDWFVGTKAGYQLLPSDPFYETLESIREPLVGVLYGGRGDDEGINGDIPGDDDRTVGVEEAQLPEQDDAVRIDTDHSRLPLVDESLRQVLWFLRHGRFEGAVR